MDTLGRIYGHCRMDWKYFRKGCEVAYDKIKDFSLLKSLRKANNCLDDMISITEEK